jgi:hypothetical protein
VLKSGAHLSADSLKAWLKGVHRLGSAVTRIAIYVNKLELWRACNLTSFSPCLTGPVDYPFASHHKGPGFKSPGGYLCETRILLLALSRYIGDPDVIDYCGLV